LDGPRLSDLEELLKASKHDLLGKGARPAAKGVLVDITGRIPVGCIILFYV
jgi:hypothetical protein